MLPGRVRQVSFSVVGSRGVVLRGMSKNDVGAWNSRYRAVYELNFSPVRRAGTYRIRVGPATSPAFRIASGQVLYQRLVSNGVRYFTSERDGADVVSAVLDRKAANLTDTSASVYAAPKYDSNDNLIGGFTKIGGPVNVSGGWFDAGGGYEKFGYTASYADALLLLAARDSRGPSAAALRNEAEFGLRWMRELWNPAKKVMYIQVGIGNGNAKIDGDYDFWFLPQAEDRLRAKPGSAAYYVEYRPVFEAAAPGKPVSPELAGRYAADYALGAQLALTGPRDQAACRSARALLALARSVYAMAKTTDVGSIVTTFPHDYYPGTEWKSAMLWGAAEIALADERLGVPQAQLRRDLAVAARWARAYLAQGHPAGGDTLNLYDNGAVAEAELLRAMRGAPGAPVIAPRLLLADMAAQLRPGEKAAAGDPFGLGTQLGASDATPHAFGLYVTDALYQEYGGSRRLRGLRAAAARLRARRQPVGRLVRGRRRDRVPVLHAERDRQPGRVAVRHRVDPARRDGRRPEQPGQLRRPRHGDRHARVQPRVLRGVRLRQRRLRGQRGVVAVGGALAGLLGDLAAGVRVRGGRAWLMPPCSPSTAATARPTWPWWPRTARCWRPCAARARARRSTASTAPCGDLATWCARRPPGRRAGSCRVMSPRTRRRAWPARTCRRRKRT